MERCRDQAGAPPLGQPLFRGERRVAIDGGEVVRNVAIGVVLQRVVQQPGRPTQLDGLMHRPSVPTACTPVVETQLIVRIPVGRPDPAADVPGHARDPVTAGRRLTIHEGANLGRELRRHALVGVERQDPVVRCQSRGVILLRAVPGQPRTSTRVASLLGDRHRSIGAAGIDDDDFVGPGDRFECRRNVRRLRSW